MKRTNEPTSRFSEASIIIPKGTEVSKSNCCCVALRKPTVVLVLEKGIRVASLRPGPVGEIRGGDGFGV